MKKMIAIGIFGVLIGLTFGVILQSAFTKDAPIPAMKKQIESSQSFEKNEEKKTLRSTEKKEIVVRSTNNQKESEQISKTCSDFISLFFSNHPDISYKEKEEKLLPFLSERGKKKLLGDYSYQDGTDLAETKAAKATNYVNFDSVTGKATVMSFMIYQTVYPEQPAMNAQTIVQIKLTKNEEDRWQIDEAEMRLLNQMMPEYYFS